MSPAYDAIVIGAGANGLSAAVCLARAGRKVLVVERREVVGGQGALIEFAPGFRADPLMADAGWLPPAVAREAGVANLERVVPEVTVAVPTGERRWLGLDRDVSKAAEAIRRLSPSDARAWPAFTDRIAKLSRFLEALYTLPPPDIEASSPAGLLTLLGVARKLRGLGREGMIDLLRLMPMSVQELLDDTFESEPLKAAIAGSGVSGLRQGPRSGGTAFLMLHHHVGAAAGAIRGRGYWKSGPDALSGALAAAAGRLGVTVRAGAGVARIVVANDRATGVVLEGGEEISAPIVLSTADPARTLLGMVDPVWLDPEFLLAVRNIKFRGCTATVLYALEGEPAFAGLDTPPGECGLFSLSGTMLDIERAADAAKYGTVSARPHVEAQIPSLWWPGLAPQGKHVLAARAQWAPYRLRDGEWTGARREELGASVTDLVEAAAPGFSRLIRERVVMAPPDIETRYGVTEGSVSQG
ncbi:MAG TPA: NAD(P)/FAD-dependent oxidoreductase, partial [Gemmatimonadales bacterium]